MVAFAKEFSFVHATPDSLIHAERSHGNFTGLAESQGLKSRILTGRNGRSPYDSCLSPPLAQGGQSRTEGLFGRILDAGQTLLDVAGLVPGFGEVADGTNALIYLARGDNVNAALSAAAMIPFAGWGATGAKVLTKYGDEALQGAHTIFKTQDGKIIKYETRIPQQNPRNPNPWQLDKRFDAQGKGHFNKTLQEVVPTPHIHDPGVPGGVRPALPDEVPPGG